MSAPMPVLAPEERNSKPVTGTSHALALLLVLASFLFLYWITTPSEAGDTLRYAGDVVQHAHGAQSQFWEFGHLLWRPWGYLGLVSLGPWFERSFGDTEAQAITRFFVLANFVCSLLTLLLIWDLLRRVVSIRLATLVTIAFCGANCFLGYIKLGSAYLPALFFECLSLWLLAKAAESSNRAIALTATAGLSYALSVLLWFPYIFVGPGVLLFLFLWPLNQNASAVVIRKKIPAATAFLVAFAAATLTVFIVGAAADGIHNSKALLRWIVEADNGWSQHLSIVRAVTGIPRALYELSFDTILLKRWFFHDPYNPVRLSQLVGALLLKLFLFYTGIAALIWILWREKAARATLIVLIGAAVPLLFFAVFVFEPGSTSRYLPILPFLYLGAAVALSVGRKRRLAYLAILVLLFSCVVLNVTALTWGNAARANRVRNQRELLNAHITRKAVVFLPTLHDEFYYVPITRPLDHSLASSKYDKYEVVDIVEPASSRILHWRSEFAARTLDAWSQGGEVWVSRHAFAQRPDRAWPWAEGDDPRVRWTDLPNFFDQFEVDRATETGNDAFVRIADSPANRAKLTLLANGFLLFLHPFLFFQFPV